MGPAPDEGPAPNDAIVRINRYKEMTMSSDNDNYIQAIRALHAKGMSCTEISRKHNLPLETVRKAVKGDRVDRPLFLEPDLKGAWNPSAEQHAATNCRKTGRTTGRRG